MAATGPPPARPGAIDAGRGAAGNTAPSTTPTAPPAGDDWAAQTADTIERIVGSVRAKTADPLEKVARAAVYGLVALIVGVAAAVLGAVALVRILDVAIPGGVWSAHALTGGIFTVAGMFLWRKRTVKTVKV
jgi:hypothetical protein